MKTFLRFVPSFTALVVTIFLLTSCAKKGADDSASENAQQIGDMMASVDEADGGDGSLQARAPQSEDKILRQSRPLFARYGEEVRDPKFSFIADAHATSCYSAPGFGSCTSNSITRNFGGCTVGIATFTGTVSLNWGGAASSCVITGAGGHITRVPNFTVTGLRSAALAVTKTGSIGQRLTYQSGVGASAVFTFSSDGIRRTFAAGGNTLLDFTTATTSDITITGSSRIGRVINGGAFRVTNNLTSEVCTYVPNNITWTSSCNCPTSGNWTGTCSTGINSNLILTGCGSAQITHGTASGDVTFDRCY